MFRFSPVHADDAVICVLAGLLPVIAFEAVKMTRLLAADGPRQG
jgi:hypothetical protein